MSLPQGPAAIKVTAEHLRRNAYLYVRQSTLRQVLTNTESTHRQYDLRGRAVALGWAAEQVIELLGSSHRVKLGRIGIDHEREPSTNRRRAPSVRAARWRIMAR